MGIPQSPAAAALPVGSQSPTAPAQGMAWWAQKYAAMCLPVFPVAWIRGDGACGCGKADCTKPGKHPLTHGGSKDATTDADTIRAWWRKHPHANIGAVPAKATPPLVVLDFDPRNGSDATKADLERKHGKFTRAVVCATGGGGEHVYFYAPEHDRLPGKLGAGIDVQHRGYVILPPSLHKSGKRYAWIDGRSLLDDDDHDFMRALPQWVNEGQGSIDGTGADSPTDVDVLARDAARVQDTPLERERVKSALRKLDPNGSRDEYMTVLRACHATGWPDAIEEIARPWAKGDMHGIECEKYDARTFNRDIKGLSTTKGREPVTVASLIKLAKAAGWTDPKQTTAKAAPAQSADGVSIRCAAEIEPEPIDWLWPGWLASRKLALIAGTPGTGKTTIAMSCTATVSNGGKWPDGTSSQQGSVLIWSGEDDPKDTLVPRLIAAGADLSRVHFVGNSSDGLTTRPFDPAVDMPALQTRAREIGDIKLLIVDPIVAAVSGDSHKNAEVRRGLAPLVDFAEAIGAALLGITHFSKGTGGRDPLERVTGSVAFGAVARLVWVTAITDKGDGERPRVLARAKSNIGPDGGGFHYSFNQVALPDHPGISASKVEWGEIVTGAARELLGEPEQQTRTGKTAERPQQWLERILDAGPVAAKEIEIRATEAGYPKRTIDRAKAALFVECTRTGNKGPWFWQLPARREGAGL